MSKYEQRVSNNPIYNNQNFQRAVAASPNVVKYDVLRAGTNNININGSFKVNGTELQDTEETLSNNSISASQLNSGRVAFSQLPTDSVRVSGSSFQDNASPFPNTISMGGS